jgi:N-acyl-D-amino-acid deacylase
LILGAGLVASAPEPQFDVLIRNGLIVDGSGAKAVRADLAITRNVIAQIGALDWGAARKVLDATGSVVAPGFIDVHTHADQLWKRPLAENFVRMGITSIVAGNCGSSSVDVGVAFDQIRRAGPSVNFATLVGHGSVRAAVMGSARRAPGPAEVAQM